MFEVEIADAPPGTVAEEIQAGYAIGDRVLRPALVGRSSGRRRRAAAAAERQAERRTGGSHQRQQRRLTLDA